MDIEVKLKSHGSAGQLMAGHGLVLFHQRGHADPTTERFQHQANMGQNENETWFTFVERSVEAGDIILPMMIYPTASIADFDLFELPVPDKLEMYLEHTVRID